MSADYITPSGREWSASPCRYHGDRCVLMSPLGVGVQRGGGVRAMHVDRERLERGDKTWRPARIAPSELS